MKPKYSVIIATKNEEEAIAKVLCSIPEEIKKRSEVIVVDSSTDYTPIIADKLGARVIRERKDGKGRAMRRGVKESKGDILIFLDGDGTDPPQFIPKLIKKLDTCNLVLGCRAIKKFKTDSWWVKNIFIPYKLFMVPFFNLAGFKVSGDPLAGFRAIRRSDWEKLNLKSNGFEIEAEMNIKSVIHGFKVKEVPIPHLKRGGGLFNSKLVTNPKMWFKIMNVVLKYVKDEKIKKKMKRLVKQYKEFLAKKFK